MSVPGLSILVIPSLVYPYWKTYVVVMTKTLAHILWVGNITRVIMASIRLSRLTLYICGGLVPVLSFPRASNLLLYRYHTFPTIPLIRNRTYSLYFLPSHIITNITASPKWRPRNKLANECSDIPSYCLSKMLPSN